MKKLKVPKPPKKQKTPKIKTMNWRKCIKYFIIAVIVFDLLGSIRGFSANAKINNHLTDPAENQRQEEKENQATSIGAQSFATKFLKEYFTWDTEEPQERIKRLQPFLRKGVDEQAGLRFDSITGKAFPDSYELWKVEETGKDTANYTFRISYKTKTTIQKEVNKKQVKEEKINGPFERWVEVPVITAGKAYLINGTPTFTSKMAPTALKEIENSESSESDPKTSAEINKFLHTFFKQYATGTAAELEYLTSDKSVKPLGGTIVFDSIEELIILDKKKKSTIIEVDALFTDRNTKVKISQKFNLEVSEKNGQYQVIKFN